MNMRLASIFTCTALAMSLAGCQKSEGPAVSSNGAPPQVVTSAAPIQPGATRDPSVPDASAVFKAQDAEKAKAAQSEDPQKKAPFKEMSKREEQTAMPLPGQANDHSSLAPKGSAK